MFSLLGITVMSTKTRMAYRDLSNKAYALHQTLWFTDDYCPPEAQAAIRLLDGELSEALSYVPASDIDSLE
jgi:hypothetical protein